MHRTLVDVEQLDCEGASGEACLIKGTTQERGRIEFHAMGLSVPESPAVIDHLLRIDPQSE